MGRLRISLRVKHPFGLYYSFEEISNMSNNLPLELEAVIDGKPRVLGRYAAGELKRNKELIELYVDRTVREFERALEEDLALMASGPLIVHVTHSGIVEYRDRLSQLLTQSIKKALRKR